MLLAVFLIILNSANYFFMFKNFNWTAQYYFLYQKINKVCGFGIIDKNRFNKVK